MNLAPIVAEHVGIGWITAAAMGVSIVCVGAMLLILVSMIVGGIWDAYLKWKFPSTSLLDAEFLDEMENTNVGT